MSNPLVSICIPTYNGSGFLRKTIESCLSQTYGNFELIINDDCSSDDTLKIAEEYAKKDNRIKINLNAVNLGLVGNWNEVLNQSSGNWIKILFQDDWMEPNCIEIMLKQAQQNADSVIISKRSYVFSEDVPKEIKKYYIDNVKKLDVSSGNTATFFSSKEIAKVFSNSIGLNFIAEPSLTFFSKKLFKSVGDFDVNFIQVCDLEHILRMASQSGVVLLNSQLTHFNVHQKSTTSKNISVHNFQIRFFEVPLLINKIRTNMAFLGLRSGFSFMDKLRMFFYIKLRAFEALTVSKRDVSLTTKYNELLNRFSFMKIKPIERVFLFPLSILANKRISKK